MRKASLEVGVLLRGQVRRTLEEAIFYGQLESYKEVKSFLSSTFLLTNPTQDFAEWLASRSDTDDT